MQSLEIANKDTGEIAQQQQPEFYPKPSLLTVTEDEGMKLKAGFDDRMIEIRPDGLIYLPQVFWRQRLNDTFGVGQWCLLIKNSAKDESASKAYVQGVLIVRGCYVAEAVGEAELHTNNANQSWASVWESAKSDCITRCCKDLGIASDLWQPEFVRKWVKENAVQVWRHKTGSKRDGSAGSFQWRKKNAEPFYDEKQSGNSGQQKEQKKEESKKAAANADNRISDELEGRAHLSKAESLEALKIAFLGLTPECQKALENLKNTLKKELTLKSKTA